ncbi:molybdopterin binding oxidoreductase [Gloeophyllum trabeum ATCC 11539]|uniref:Molybdopterin binding oxidoreductase n=1 Tax=Gloeophyllum trabeum (strain ATCC 11539 / FP-39264 / Madison 617) TaxID=670483 RepID=S7RIZ6_GLOTA|nr:molybdopterin binding oxidoreductase [Gloeophyllum trabeum ATCC 11539]EPQ54335.1 molybdopterin binding oxidoreductase [Gloeophyllum trabeum ATCC 11539]
MDPSTQSSFSNRLSVLQEQPYNAEPDLVALVAQPYTPDELIYCRNHSPVKCLEADTFTLSVRGLVQNALQFRLDDLKRIFPRVEVVAALQCAGNRRKTMAERKKRNVDGVKWNEGVICNVRWAGVSMRQLLLAAGVRPPAEHDKPLHLCMGSHIAACSDDNWFGTSISLEKAMDEEGDVIIAYEMNGHPLTPEHGYPFRVVVPGYTGVRWVKWVDSILVSDREPDNFYHKRDYKVLPEEVCSRDQAHAGGWWCKVPPLQFNPLNSVVASVSLRTSPQTFLCVKGYAMAGVTGQVKAVEVSIDSGRTWRDAHITYQEGKWSWTLWEATLELSDAAERVWCRAIDESGAVQPADSDWNLRGLAYSGYGEIDLRKVEGNVGRSCRL